MKCCYATHELIDQVKFATPLSSAFCFPCLPLCFIIFDELAAVKYINEFENSDITNNFISFGK